MNSNNNTSVYLTLLALFSIVFEHFGQINSININRKQATNNIKKINNLTSSHLTKTTEQRQVVGNYNEKVHSIPFMTAQVDQLAQQTKRMLKRLQQQNEDNTEKLSECYHQLGKHTRLMIASDKRRALNDLFIHNSQNNNNNYESMINNTTTINRGGEKKSNQKQQPQPQRKDNKYSSSALATYNPNSFVLQSDLNYFLNELDRNYLVIQELQSKLNALNRTNLPLDNADHQHSQESADKEANNNPKSGADCMALSGNGFVQINIKLDGEDYVDHKDPLMTIKDQKMTVYCESHWLVIQQRLNGFEIDFNKTWQDYKKGFGSIRGDFWIGLEIIATLTQSRPHKLLIELTDWSDQIYTAEYESFEIGSERESYRLSLSGSYSGNASKDFMDDLYYGFTSQNGAHFSTYDFKKTKLNMSASASSDGSQQQQESIFSKLNQKLPQSTSYHNRAHNKNCAARSGGGWWFNNFSTCLPVNLNGIYVTGASAPSMRGIKWQAIRPNDRNYGLKSSKMKIQPSF